MEAAVSANAANSKWLGLGLGRQRGVFGKQSLLSINGVGYTRKMMMMMSNSMNCMRRFRLESSWMGMGPRPIERQRFSSSGSGQGDVENDDDYDENCDHYEEMMMMMMMSISINCMRWFRLESSWMGMGPRPIERQRFSSSGSGQGDVENGDAYVENDDHYDENGDHYDENGGDSDDDYVENCDDYDENGDASPVYLMNKGTAACVEYAVATCVGVGLVMFGIGCLLGYFYLPMSTHGIISRIAFMAIVLFHALDLICVFVKSLLVNKLVRVLSTNRLDKSYYIYI